VDRHFKSKWTQEIQSLTIKLEKLQNELFAAQMKKTRLRDTNHNLESKLTDNISHTAIQPCNDDAYSFQPPLHKCIYRCQPSLNYITVPLFPSVVALSPGPIPDQEDKGL
jgi:hypothetical protein